MHVHLLLAHLEDQQTRTTEDGGIDDPLKVGDRSGPIVQLIMGYQVRLKAGTTAKSVLSEWVPESSMRRAASHYAHDLREVHGEGATRDVAGCAAIN